MKLSRLFQPRNPLFWLMLLLNVLSAALAWVVQYRQLNGWASLIVGIFAVGNALMGSWLIWRLLSDDTASRPPN